MFTKLFSIVKVNAPWPEVIGYCVFMTAAQAGTIRKARRYIRQQLQPFCMNAAPT
jgi:hypothetical protein